MLWVHHTFFFTLTFFPGSVTCGPNLIFFIPIFVIFLHKNQLFQINLNSNACFSKQPRSEWSHCIFFPLIVILSSEILKLQNPIYGRWRVASIFTSVNTAAAACDVTSCRSLQARRRLLAPQWLLKSWREQPCRRIRTLAAPHRPRDFPHLTAVCLFFIVCFYRPP